MLDLIHVSIPFFVLLLLLELGLAAYGQKKWFETKDTVSSLAMGIGNVVVGLFGKGLVLGTYLFIYQFKLFEIESTWWAWIILVFGDDFSYYWFHRVSHGVRFFWASHVVHHSSQKYNLSTALRQTWTGQLTGTFIFWAWLPLLGFHPLIVISMQSISLLYQFWIHTEAIDKFPRWIELIFNTPSHHRVHHSSELLYLDKNHAGIFIIWDRIFGTFQEEMHRPTYGLTQNIKTFNPVRIAFHEWIRMANDTLKSRSINQVFMYLFGPPGWSHDGRSKTTKQLRMEAQRKTK